MVEDAVTAVASRPSRLLLWTSAFATVATLGAGVGAVVVDPWSDRRTSTESPVCDPWNDVAGDLPGDVEPEGEPFADDPDLRSGTLDNGLRYLVRQNGRPGQSVTMMLVVPAGSAMEDSGQAGAAHFVEHMAFNGTERYPGNEVQEVLGALGAAIGPDLNAYTSFDETVYRLEVPAEDEAIATALSVIGEWIDGITFLPADVEAERGVILEELRAGRGPGGRAADRLQTLTFSGTIYEGRAPIGTRASIAAMSADVLRRFHDDWYQPEQLAVVLVGDLEPSVLEAAVRDQLSGLEGSGGRSAPDRTVVRRGVPFLQTYVDDELASTSVELVFTESRQPATHPALLEAELAADVAMDVLSERLRILAARGSAPFHDASAGRFRGARGVQSAFVQAEAAPDDLAASLDALLASVSVVRAGGVTEAEVARAVAFRRRREQASLAAAATVQDFEVASTLVDHHLDGSPAPSAAGAAERRIAALDAVTAPMVTDALRRITRCGSMGMQVGGPADVVGLPAATDVPALIADASQRRPELPLADQPTPRALMATPAPVEPVRIDSAALYGTPARILTYASGLQVVIHPTDIAGGSIQLVGESAGGMSLVADGDVAAARAANTIVNDSGVGDTPRLQLDAFVDERSLDVATRIGLVDDHVAASAPSTEIEALLQLVHLRLARPRVDGSALASYRARLELLAADPMRNVEAAVATATHEAFRRGEPRLAPFPSTPELAALDPDTIRRVHGQRFGDVGDFAMVLVGDLDLEQATDLANRYLGSLPGSNRVEQPPPALPAPPRGATTRVVEVGQDAQGSYVLAFDSDLGAAPELLVTEGLANGLIRHRSALLGELLQRLLTTRLREQLGVTYSPTVDVEVHDRAQERVTTTIRLAVDPARLDEVGDEVQRMIEDVRRFGPSQEDIDAVLAPMRRDLAFISNDDVAADWLLLLDALRTGSPAGPAQTRSQATPWLEGIVPDDVARLVDVLLPDGRFVEIVQRPAR